MPNMASDSGGNADRYAYVPARKPPTLPAFSSLNTEQRDFVGALMATLMQNDRPPAGPAQGSDHSVTRTFKDVVVSGRKWDVLMRNQQTPPVTYIAARSGTTVIGCNISAAEHQAHR